MWSDHMLVLRVEKPESSPELPACDCVDDHLPEQLLYLEAKAGGVLENRCHKHGESVIV